MFLIFGVETMKNLDLNSYGVQEMDAKAMEEANGGFILGALIAAAAIVVVGAAELIYDAVEGRRFDVRDGDNLLLPDFH